MNDKELRWLEAAYLYYLHPEHGELMTDYEWDKLSEELKGERTSLFWMKEEDYPEDIRNKYENLTAGH